MNSRKISAVPFSLFYHRLQLSNRRAAKDTPPLHPCPRIRPNKKAKAFGLGFLVGYGLAADYSSQRCMMRSREIRTTSSTLEK